MLNKFLERLTGKSTRMFYTNFDENITARHNIIVKNWPLHVFCPPGDVRTFTELKILHDAWESGTAQFYRFTTVEATEWSNKRFEKSVKETTGPGTLATPPPSLPSLSANAPPSPSAMPSTTMSASPTAMASTPSGDVIVSPHVDGPQGTQISDVTSPTPTSDHAPVTPTSTPVVPVNDSSAAPSTTVPRPLTHPASPPPAPSHPESASLAGATLNGTKRPSDNELHQSAPNKKRRQGPSMMMINTMVVTSADGSTVVMNQKPRKERSDKGKKRK